MRIAVACSIAALSSLGCRTSTTYLNADELARSPSDAAGSAPCNDLEQHGKEVTLKGTEAPAPTPAGGTIEDGVYVLTSSTLHTKDKLMHPSLVKMGKTTMRVSGTTSQLVRNTVNGHERRTTMNRVSSGTVASLQMTCAFPSPSGSDATSTAAYTATSSTLQFITPGPAGTVVATYTKLPPSTALTRRE